MAVIQILDIIIYVVLTRFKKKKMLLFKLEAIFI